MELELDPLSEGNKQVLSHAVIETLEKQLGDIKEADQHDVKGRVRGCYCKGQPSGEKA